MLHLSHAAARTLMLAAQGLLRPPAAGATKADVRDTIRRMSVLQIDTIQVVARSPYLVLWSRLGDYAPVWLDELLSEGALFEYWSHEACFLPIENYPLYRRLMLEGQIRGWQHMRDWSERHPGALETMLAHVREHGPVRSADFERVDGESGAWWNWKHEKATLEMLFSLGDLMIARRVNFQRVYDLRERVLPAWDDAQAPPLAEVRRAMVLRAVRALGVAHARWVADYFRTNQRDTLPVIAALADEGLLLRARIDGLAGDAYIHPDHAALAEQAAAGALRPELTTLLSPFDPLVWDRQRASVLFGFDYRLECYTPAPKRRYGYFTLPILHRGRLVGRLDPKAHRKEGIFEVKTLHLEPGVPLDEQLLDDLAAALRACAAWHGTPQVAVRWSDPPELAELLTRNA
ncbi:MAG TPA: crosslink repair DNA glycosylase YcaQ family protein [Roseiflexaceae bacterium]|nr:crosslink repair DNA glycosylase YcaQ family protein [Roseiflexaceae bacterium]